MTWVGSQAHIYVDRVGVATAIPKERLDDSRHLIQKVIHLTWIPRKDVRAIAGKAMNIALTFMVWKPFLDCSWTALKKPTPEKAPRLYIPQTNRTDIAMAVGLS